MINAGWHAHFEEHLAELEACLERSDKQGYYKHLKATVSLEGGNADGEQYIKGEGATLLRDKGSIREWWVGFYRTLLTPKSLTLGPTISEQFPHRPVAPRPGLEPTMEEM